MLIRIDALASTEGSKISHSMAREQAASNEQKEIRQGYHNYSNGNTDVLMTSIIAFDGRLDLLWCECHVIFRAFIDDGKNICSSNQLSLRGIVSDNAEIACSSTYTLARKKE